jgi:hypothetical protein
MSNQSARRTKSYTAATITDADGVKTSFATTTAVQTFTAGSLNGAAITSGVLDLPRSLTVALSNTTGAFTTDPIVITGKRGGATVTASFTPADANGNATLARPQAFDSISEVVVPAQVLTTATMLIGVQDICAPAGTTFVGVELAAAGTLNVQYGEQTGSQTDAIPVPAVAIGFVKPVAPTRVLTSATLAGTPTTVGLTVYLE